MKLRLLGWLLICILPAGLAAQADDWDEERIAKIVTKGHSLPETAKINHFEHMDDALIAVFSEASGGNHALDFIAKPINRLVRLTEIAGKPDSVSFGSNWGLRLVKFVNGEATGERQDLSIIYGRVPFPAFTEIEISWNCKVAERKALSSKGFFVFWRPGPNWRRCKKMYVFDAAGTKFLIERDGATGKWVPVKAS